MARRRYQRGSLIRVKDRWIGRWREDVIVDGQLKRIGKKETIGTVAEYPTKKLAQRALDLRLSVVNSPAYRARPTATFQDFAERWINLVLSQKKPSYQKSSKSVINRHLIPAFGKFSMNEITPEAIQAFVAGEKLSGRSPKSIRNSVMLLRSMWNSAKQWGYVAHDPVSSVELPLLHKKEPKYFTVDEMKRIIASADEPYKTLYWLAAETGMRAGELAGLTWEDIDEDRGIVRVRQSAWGGTLQQPKSARGVRSFAVSNELCKRLGELRAGRRAEVPLVFHTSNATPVDPNLIVKRKLKPLCEKLGIEPAGFHAFRHGNATAMDRQAVPAAVRQSRLGHSDMRVTLGYTHTITEDDRKFAQSIGVALTGEKEKAEENALSPQPSVTQIAKNSVTQLRPESL